MPQLPHCQLISLGLGAAGQPARRALQDQTRVDKQKTSHRNLETVKSQRPVRVKWREMNLKLLMPNGRQVTIVWPGTANRHGPFHSEMKSQRPLVTIQQCSI